MPIDSRLIFTQNVRLSNASTQVDGVPIIRTTPYVSIGTEGIPLGGVATATLVVPAFTNANGATGVGAFTAALLTSVVQGNGGDPTTEALWQDVATMHSIGGVNYMRPFVPTGSTGEGTVANPVRSNRAVARFVSPYTNYRLSLQIYGSYANFSNPTAWMGFGERNVDGELI